ncbi:AP-5 complex subunit zeta-1-like [Glandiceps talaboti]
MSPQLPQRALQRNWRRFLQPNKHNKMAAPLCTSIAVENVIEQLRGISEEDFKDFNKKVTWMFQSKERESEVLNQLRQLFGLVSSVKFGRNLSKDLVTQLKKVLTEPNQGSGRLCLAVLTVLREYCPVEMLSVEDFKTLEFTKQIPYILPAINNQGRRLGHFDTLIPLIVRWVSTVGFDRQIQTTLVGFIASLLMLHKDMLSSEQVQVVSSQLADWLRNASIHQAPNPFSRKLFRGEQDNLVTDIDGVPSRDIFTILSIGQYFSTDQLLNIHGFSMLRSWLLQTQTETLETPSDIKPLPHAAIPLTRGSNRGSSDRERQNLREKTCEYCLRIIDQCERKPLKPQDADLQHACLVEAVSVLNILCEEDPGMVARFFPTIKRVYSQISDNMDYPRVHLVLIQFFLNHVKKTFYHLNTIKLNTGESMMYDCQQSLDAFFGQLLTIHYCKPSSAFDIVMFLQDNLELLCLHTKCMEKYFPNILKILAWNPRTYLTEFVDILPSMVSPNTAIEVFHTLVDLPCMTAALEVMQRASRFDLSSPMGGELLIVPGGSIEAYLTPINKPLFHFITRAKAGHGDTIDRLNVLHRLVSDMRLHPRVTVCGQAVSILLHLYFQTVVEHATFDLICKLLPVMLERSAEIYGSENYKKDIRRVLADNLCTIFKLHPGLIFEVRSDLMDFIDGLRNVTGREDFFIHMVWIIGEYCSSTYDDRCTPEIISKYYESLETLCYEISMSIHATSGQPHYSIRLLTVLMSAVAKLASRCQDLIPRVLLCLSKIAQQQRKSDIEEENKLVVTDRANELVNLLKLPNVASIILSPAADLESGRWHTDNNTSIPMMLQATTDILQQFSV